VNLNLQGRGASDTSVRVSPKVFAALLSVLTIRDRRALLSSRRYLRLQRTTRGLGWRW